jgi:hypothetical protein
LFCQQGILKAEAITLSTDSAISSHPPVSVRIEGDEGRGTIMVLDDLFFDVMLFLLLLMVLHEAYTWLRGRGDHRGARPA